MKMVMFILSVCLVSFSSARPLLHEIDPTEFLAISCEEYPLFGVHTEICSEYFSSLSTVHPSTVRPSVTPLTIPTVPRIVAETAALADWLKVLLSLISFSVAAYSCLVSYFKFARGYGLVRAMLLGACGRLQVEDIDHSQPTNATPDQNQTQREESV